MVLQILQAVIIDRRNIGGRFAGLFGLPFFRQQAHSQRRGAVVLCGLAQPAFQQGLTDGVRRVGVIEPVLNALHIAIGARCRVVGFIPFDGEKISL